MLNRGKKRTGTFAPVRFHPRRLYVRERSVDLASPWGPQGPVARTVGEIEEGADPHCEFIFPARGLIRWISPSTPISAEAIKTMEKTERVTAFLWHWLDFEGKLVSTARIHVSYPFPWRTVSRPGILRRLRKMNIIFRPSFILIAFPVRSQPDFPDRRNGQNSFRATSLQKLPHLAHHLKLI